MSIAFMDGMPDIGTSSDVMVSDDQLTTALQQLLVSVEKGIERLELNGIFKSVQDTRCCNTKDSSVQTSDHPSLECLSKEVSVVTPNNEATSQLSSISHLFGEEDIDDGYCEHILTQPATVNQVDPDLLHSQIAFIPGCRDLKGRSCVVISSDAIKDNNLSSCHLAQLFLYFHSIPEKEIASRGFLVLVDASKHFEDFWNTLDETFCLIEANLSNVISEVIVLLQNEDELSSDPNKLFPTSRVQCEMCSYEKLVSRIHRNQLLKKYGGKYTYDHQEWISFRKFLEPFMNGCRLSGRYLVSLLEELRGHRLPISSSLTHQMIEQQKRIVSLAFHDEQLRHLEEEGDTILKELLSYRTKSPHNHDYRENLEKSVVLYGEVRKAMTKLSRLADIRLNKLEECLQLKTFQEESSQVLSWFCRKGNESLEKHQIIADSLAAIKLQEEEFEKFYFLAMRQIDKGNDLLEEVSSHDLPKINEENPTTEGGGDVQDLALSLKQHLGSFSEKLEGTREKIEDTAKCYQLMDKSYEWALEAMRFVSHMGMTESCEGIMKQIQCLQDYSENHLRVPEDTLSEMLELATKLGNEKLLEQCRVVKQRCEETVELIQARQTTLQKVKQQAVVDNLRGPSWEAEDVNQTPRTMRSNSQPTNSWLPVRASTPYSIGFSSHQRRRSTGGPLNLSAATHRLGSYTSFPSSYYPTAKESYQFDNYIQDKETSLLSRGIITEDLTSQGPVATISLLGTRIGQRDSHCSSSSSASSCSKESREEESPNNVIKSGSKKLNRRWQMRDEALEKAKAEVREQTALLRIEKLKKKGNMIDSSESSEDIHKKSYCQIDSSPVPVNTHLTPPPLSPDETALESKSKKTLMNIMKELIQTERDYVNSLEYIIENYIPELTREDIPQALRGKRNVIFGNIEKIYEFHNQYFLAELEHCENSPFTVGQCFLDFQNEFYLYALYNKNKPKSDALMSEYGNTFFRASEEMVRFQLRHGNDLLAMDALKDCDVNVKEQGRLLRQEEFIVWHGRLRKNMMRHIFLFEDLVLFSKAQRDPQRKGYEVYHYKHSIKTTDLGLTEQLGDSPTKFEIWFRKRKESVTFKLQAPTPEIKAAWVTDIRKILLRQACMNKVNRQAENQSMGIGNKPCLDIRPSEDQISDRSISIQQLTRAPRYRGSGTFESRKDRNSMISVCSSSSSSSSSQSSPFPFFGTLNLGFEPGDSPRPLQRSLTQQSQCSTESGFYTDMSTAGDSPEADPPRHKRAERSDSLLSSDSLATNMSPTESLNNHSLEESLTTSM
ncbi:puratrophin-1 isoform X2 [Parasteatoda tepidariorum]|uniref:puratrophin-1 isoform X2 n=1 Tax=Parasteatoda tepidariorum TaxID=114398 RepID=UPI001C7248D6|nr:puratrophin-1 isoform X2 [Parasteatoda tepidariorum]